MFFAPFQFFRESTYLIRTFSSRIKLLHCRFLHATFNYLQISVQTVLFLVFLNNKLAAVAFQFRFY